MRPELGGPISTAYKKLQKIADQGDRKRRRGAFRPSLRVSTTHNLATTNTNRFLIDINEYKNTEMNANKANTYNLLVKKFVRAMVH